MGKHLRDSTRQTDKNTKKLRAIYGEPIIIPHTQEHLDETPLPAENNPLPRFILIGGTIAAVLCVWWFVPELPTSLIKQLSQIIGR